MRKISASVVCVVAVWCAVCVPHARAHEARFVNPAQHDITYVTEVQHSQAFYGELRESPHLYEFTITSPTSFFAEILVPDIDAATNDKSGLLLSVTEDGVREVVRMQAKTASWETFYEWFSGDSYRRGASYFDSLEPGTYQLEVSTPVNKGKYVLVIGKEEVLTKGYFALLRDIKEVKLFFGKSAFRSIESPLFYIPIIALALCLCGGYLFFRRQRKK